VGGWERGGAVASPHPAAPPLSRELVDAAVPLPRDDVATGVRAEGRGALSRLLREGPGRALFPIRHVGSPFWLCYGLWGFEGLMTLVADDPGLVRHACSRFLEASVREARKAAALGAEGIWVEECLTDMVGAAEFRGLVVPFLDALLREIRSLGMYSIYYFCGNPAGKWDPILSLPADALALEEGKKGFRIDIEEVVDRVDGRLCLLGNLDAIRLLHRAGEAELEAEIGRQIRAGRRNRGRFLMSIGSPVTPGTSAGRIRLYCDMARRIGGGRD
jgi:uroporphyrinogen-III decarboxylase